MRRGTLAVALCASILGAGAPAPARALSPAALTVKLTRELRLAGPSSGAYAVDLDSGRALVSIRASVARPPASVNKLFTTSTALARLGPDATFDTAVLRKGTALYVRGAGDPTLSTARLSQLARSVASEVDDASAVVGDETLFDQRRGSFDSGFALDSDVEGQLGALVVDRGYTHGRFQPFPGLFAAGRFTAALRAAKVHVGGTRVGATPGDAEEVAVTPSATVQRLIAATNVPSDNFYAEMLLKDLGAREGSAGTTAQGADVVERYLGTLGVHATVVDGSGLSRADRAAPSQVVGLLKALDRDSLGATFTGSLAVTGRSGTVAKRMRGTAASGACRVKTGTLRGVSNLAGVCATRGGRRVAFAWLMSGVNPVGARRIQDRMTAALASVSP